MSKCAAGWYVDTGASPNSFAARERCGCPDCQGASPPSCGGLTAWDCLHDGDRAPWTISRLAVIAFRLAHQYEVVDSKQVKRELEAENERRKASHLPLRQLPTDQGVVNAVLQAVERLRAQRGV